MIPTLKHYSDIVSVIPSGSTYGICMHMHFDIMSFFGVSVIYFDSLSDIRSGIYSDILSGKYSDILTLIKSRDPHLAGGDK